MTLLGRDAPQSIETRSVFINTSPCDSPLLRFDHLDVRTSYSSGLASSRQACRELQQHRRRQNVTTHGGIRPAESRVYMRVATPESLASRGRPGGLRKHAIL